MNAPRLRLGVSACLLGQPVRWNGGHKRDRYLTDILGAAVEWVPICPEVEIGLGVPRPTIRLEGPTGATRLIEPESGRDLTDDMTNWAESWLPSVGDLDGFIFKNGSPSCGIDRVRRWHGDRPGRNAEGVFSTVLRHQRPIIAWIDEGRMHDPGLRADFLDHALWHRRWREVDVSDRNAVMTFHRHHKLVYMAHAPGRVSKLGKKASEGGEGYGALGAQIMRTPTTRGRITNVLQHLAGFVSKHLDEGDRAELEDAILDYRRGTMPLPAPLVLLRHHVRRCPVPDWLLEQAFLDPLPREWEITGDA